MYSIVEMMSVLAVNIDDDEAKELIEQLKKSTNVRLFDCITFFDGLDILELRLNILDPYFDYFIIVEARRLSENTNEKLSIPNSFLSNFHGTTVNCPIIA
jgi:hypothetical protein